MITNNGTVPQEQIIQNSIKTEPATDSVVDIPKPQTQQQQTTQNLDPNYSYIDQVNQVQQNQNELKVYPVSWGKQISCTITTTALSFLPMAVKLFNDKKDSNINPISFDDVVDLLLYKTPDAYSYLERIAYGTKLEKWVARGKLIKWALPLLPTIKNLTKNYKMNGSIKIDLELAAHIITFIGNIAIPFILTNPYINYAFDSLFKGSIQNFVISNMMRSSNPLIREVGNFIPMCYMVGNKIKTVTHAVQTEMKGKDQQIAQGIATAVDGQTTGAMQNPIYNQQQVDYNKTEVKDGFKKVVDTLSGIFGSRPNYNTGYNSWNSGYGPYGYDVFGRPMSYGIWGGNSHM